MWLSFFGAWKDKKMKGRKLKTKVLGIILAFFITTIFSYDEFIKSSNNKGFLL